MASLVAASISGEKGAGDGRDDVALIAGRMQGAQALTVSTRPAVPALPVVLLPRGPYRPAAGFDGVSASSMPEIRCSLAATNAPLRSFCSRQRRASAAQFP